MNLEKHIHSLEKALAELTIENQRLQGDFSKWTPEQIEDQNEYDLREMKHYYGGWDELRKVIEILEENDNEAAYERHCNDY